MSRCLVFGTESNTMPSFHAVTYPIAWSHSWPGMNIAAPCTHTTSQCAMAATHCRPHFKIYFCASATVPMQQQIQFNCTLSPIHPITCSPTCPLLQLLIHSPRASMRMPVLFFIAARHTCSTHHVQAPACLHQHKPAGTAPACQFQVP